MISLEKWKILTPLHKLPKNVRDLGKLIVAKGFKKLPKVQKIVQSGHTGGGSLCSWPPFLVDWIQLLYYIGTNNMFFLVKASLVKLETIPTVILPKMVIFFCNT